MTVIGLAGSFRDDSSSLAATDIALAGARAAGASVELLDVRDLDLPMYERATHADHAGIARLVAAVRRADGMVWGSPLYHGSISGAFKNALDWLEIAANDDPPYLTDKVIGLICTAGGTQGLQGINAMEFIVRALRAWTVPLVIPIAQAYRAFDDAGNARDPATDANLRALGAEVARASRRFRRAGLTDAAATAAETDVDRQT